MLLYHRFTRKQTVALPLTALNLVAKVKTKKPNKTVCLENKVNVVMPYYNISLPMLYGYLNGKRSRPSVLKNCIWASLLPLFLPAGQKFLITKITPVSPSRIQLSYTQTLAQALCCKNTFCPVTTGTHYTCIWAADFLWTIQEDSRNLQKHRDPSLENTFVGGSQ